MSVLRIFCWVLIFILWIRFPPGSSITTTNRTYFKLLDIGRYSSITLKKLRNIIHRYCNNTDIKFEISKLFSNKDKVPNPLKSHVIYLFECADCKERYFGENNRHLQTRVNEHLQADRNSQIFKHLKTSDNCRNLYNSTCFKTLDTAGIKYQLNLKEGYYILHSKPELNKQQDHVILNLPL